MVGLKYVNTINTINPHKEKLVRVFGDYELRQVDEVSLQVDGVVRQVDEVSLQVDEVMCQVDEVSLQVDEVMCQDVQNALNSLKSEESHHLMSLQIAPG